MRYRSAALSNFVRGSLRVSWIPTLALWLDTARLDSDFAMNNPTMLISSMGGSSVAVLKTPQTWHIAMPAEQPSTASGADVSRATDRFHLTLRADD